ncbi:MAG: hypothetical protein OXU20_25290, partial [Myxococcales bacterium]|nr:hypothetical protein [Myxococcales bacterium]
MNKKMGIFQNPCLLMCDLILRCLRFRHRDHTKRLCSGVLVRQTMNRYKTSTYDMQRHVGKGGGLAA